MTDLTIRDHLIIESLKQQPLTVRKLSEVLLVSPGAVYASLMKLTTLGYVKVKTYGSETVYENDQAVPL